MFCTECGKDINDKAAVCIHCGVATPNSKAAIDNKGADIGMKLLSLFIPIVGLILYLSWKDTKPIAAKDVGKFAIIGVCISAGLGILMFIISMAMVGSAMSSFPY